MTEEGGLSDVELRARILEGQAAAAVFQDRYRKSLERYLTGMCDRTDGRSIEKSVEIAGQILAQCFSGHPSLLEKWRGGDSIEAFLRKAAANRLKSWWASCEKTRTEVNSESASLQHAAEPRLWMDRDEVESARRALRAGVDAAQLSHPEGLVFMRLKGLHGVDQRLIARCWGHHEAQTSRRIRETMTLIREVALAHGRANGVELHLDLLTAALHGDPSVLLGDAAQSDPVPDPESLERLAAGKADAAARAEAARAMCADPRLLACFAGLLNGRHGWKAAVARDPALDGMGARLSECLRRSLDALEPAAARELVTPLMAESFADHLRSVGADGGTLWLLCPGATALEAVFNPLEPEIVGKRQPLVSGIISLVLATSEAACVTRVPYHEHHSPSIDISLGKMTHSMIVVPFIVAGGGRGVLTAVRLKPGLPFDDGEMRRLIRHADVFAELFEGEVSRGILG